MPRILTPNDVLQFRQRLCDLALKARGSGVPVMVLPGLGASNTSTVLLRSYLSWLGYSVQGWALGRNRGNVQELLPQVEHIEVRATHLGLRISADVFEILARKLAQA